MVVGIGILSIIMVISIGWYPNKMQVQVGLALQYLQVSKQRNGGKQWDTVKRLVH